MPTYDFQCDACGHTFEEWQSFKDEPLSKCPKCKKKKLRRLFGNGAAVLFKGSGFYETDYRRDADSYQSAQKAESGTPAPATTETKAETPASPPPPAATESPSSGSAKKAKK